MSEGPLAGVRVFDATLQMVGPWCTMQLGALGADVVHIESPEFAYGRTSGRQVAAGRRRPPANAPGAQLRHPQTLPKDGVGPTMWGTSVGYMMWNMNKRGLVLDFKAPDDLAFAYDLLKTSDVVVQNMRPGVMERLGLGYEKARELNPRIIYASISGWGQRGPMSRLIGHDGTAQHSSGWISINGAEADAWETYRHPTQLDAGTGNHAAQAILAALVARERTGQGQQIEVSMLEAAVSVQTSRVAEFIATGESPRPMRSGTPTIVPEDSFLCLDNEWIAVSASTDAQWRAMCGALGLTDFEHDDALATNAGRIAQRARITERLTALFASKPFYWWVHVLNAAGVPASRFMKFDELRYHPQVTENRFMPQIPTKHWGTMYAGGAPWHFSETPERMFAPPYPDDHNEEVRADVAREIDAGLTKSAAPQRAQGPTSAGTDLSPERPLGGFLVVDLSQGRAGPHASMLMADAGARVVKVEPPSGDTLRRQGPPFIGDDAAAFVLLNRSKEGVAIDPESPADRQLFADLLRRADVVIEDWHSEFSRALDFDYETLRGENPRALCLSVTGWGERGPWAERPQAELTAQFAAEIPLSLGHYGDPPIRVGADIAHAYPGVFGFQAVCAALFSREHTGRGQQIFVSMFGSLMFMRGTLWAAHSDPDAWTGRLDDNSNEPGYEHALSFRCNDGLVMFTPRIADRAELEQLLGELGVDPATVGTVPNAVFAQGSNEVSIGAAPIASAARVFWEPIIATKSVIDVCLAAEMHGGGIPLFDYEMLSRSPQAAAIDLFVEIDDPKRGKYHVVAAPWAFVSPSKASPTPAPTLDEHHERLVAELGMGSDARA